MRSETIAVDREGGIATLGQPEGERVMAGALFWGLLAGAFILAGLVQWYFYRRGLYAISADESGRTLLAHAWQKTKQLQLHSWLPLPQIITGLSLDLWPNLFRVPRAISFVFGLLTLGSLTLLAHELFRSRPITLLSAWLGAIFSFRVILSVVPLSENMYFATVLLGCALVARWLNGHQTGVLLLAGLVLAVGNAIRYESWFFSVILLGMVLLTCLRGPRRTSWWVPLALFVLMFAFPLYWLAMFAIRQGEMFRFARITANEYKFIYGNTWAGNLQRGVPWQFLRENWPQLNLLGLFSLGWLLCVSRPLRFWSILPVASFVIISVASLTGRAMPSHNFWRLPAIWSLMLVPFTAHFLWELHPGGAWPLSGNRILRWGVTALAVAAVGLLFWRATLKHVDMRAFTLADRQAGEYLYSLVKTPGSPTFGKALIDTSSWSYINVQVCSQRPDYFILNAGLDVMRQHKGILTGQPAQNAANLKAKGIRYLVLYQPTLVQLIARTPGTHWLKDFGHWSIWEFRP